MKKISFRKFNHSFLSKKTPLLGFTVLQLVILFVVINGGTVAVLLSQRQEPVVQDTSTNLPISEATAKQPAKATSTTAEDTSQPTPKEQNKPTTSKSATNTNSLPDQYGCIPQSSGYESCVTYAKKNALSAWCSGQSKKASDTYIPESNRAKAAYDEVMAQWEAVKNLPYYQRHPYEQYAADAKTKYNAIIKPAYATYVSTINSLNAQGCNEILTYTDTSWAGY